MSDEDSPEVPSTSKSANDRPTIQMKANEPSDGSHSEATTTTEGSQAGQTNGTDSQLETDTVGEVDESQTIDKEVAPDDEAESAKAIDDLSWIWGSDDETELDTPNLPSPSLSVSVPPADDLYAVDHATLNNRLKIWAAENKVSDDPYVFQLSNDLSSRRRLTYWAAINPLDHLPSPRANSGRFLRGLARLFLLFRNIGVFVPVALTWLAINKATDAFGRYAVALSNDPSFAGQDANFLQFWQSGGPGGEYLGSSWRIQHVAFLDALIIMVIIALTLLAGALEARATVLTEKRRDLVDRARTAMAIEIGRGLHGNRTASPESIGEALATALSDLSEAARNVVVATTRLENSTSAIDELNPRLEALSQQIAALGRHFANDVVSSVSTLSTSVGSLGATLGGDMNRFLSEVLAGIEEINESFKKTSVTVEFGTKQLRDDLEAIHARLSQVVGRR